MNKPQVIITHHAVSSKRHTAKDVNEWHKARWPNFTSWAGWHCGYHYVIEWDGTLVKTREHNEEGAHTIGMNKSSIGVCFMGNFDKHLPHKAQLETWNKLYDKIVWEEGPMPTMPHRTYAKKSCHGSLLADDHFAKEYQIFTLRLRLKTLIAQLKELLNKRK